MNGIDLSTWAANNLAIVKPITFHDPAKNSAFWEAIRKAIARKRAGFVGVEQALAKSGIREVKPAKYD